MIYLGSSNSPDIEKAVLVGEIGRLCRPRDGEVPSRGGVWGADNECFTLGDRFDLTRYLDWLARVAPYADRCLFASAPDVVGDHEATVARSAPVLPVIRDLGFPAAFVGQDGATPRTVPWEDFDVLFVGGSTEWKLGHGARTLCDEAKDRGVPIHVGRVNSGKRYRYARDVLHGRSADGTFLSFAPDTNLARMRRWFDN